VQKTARKTELPVLWHSTGFPSGLSVFVSSVFLLLPVTMVDKNKGCRLLFASHIGHIVIRKDEKKA